MLYETVVGLIIAVIGASQVFTTPWLSWPRRLINKVCETSDKQVRHALKATLGWPVFLFGIFVALPLPERYDAYAAGILLFFFFAYKLGGFTTAAGRIGHVIDGDTIDVTPTATPGKAGEKAAKT